VNYRVTILPLAKRQLLEHALWWSENRSAEQAFYWLEGFEQALSSLANNPERCVRARENEAFQAILRELHYGLRNKATHRAIFEIRKDEVLVYSVRHLAQRDLSPEDVGPPSAR
jgi:plasmid stabilization system protein ParE